MSLAVLQDAIELGMIFSIMSLGVFLSFRVLNIPDLTIDGSFTTGCAISAIIAQMGHPVLGVFMAFVLGAMAGGITGQTVGGKQTEAGGLIKGTATEDAGMDPAGIEL